MKGKALLAMIVLGSLLAAGCEPVNSLFELYAKDDKLFDLNLVGEWRQVAPSDSDSTKNARWLFLHDGDTTVYKASYVELGGRGGFLAKGRLVPLGSAVFVDFAPDTAPLDDGWTTLPYPMIESHVIGRIWIEKDIVRIHFLNDDWVKRQLKLGKLTIAHAGADDNPVLNASTEELRKFALEHADDKEAFSENYELARVK